MDIVLSITPEYLKPEAASKRAKIEDGSKASSNDKGNAKTVSISQPSAPPSQSTWGGNNGGYNNVLSNSSWNNNGWGSASNALEVVVSTQVGIVMPIRMVVGSQVTPTRVTLSDRAIILLFWLSHSRIGNAKPA